MTPFGLLNINKPAGMTSRAAVDRVERLVRPAKAGHAGTLDPLATGVLVICVGQATRLIRYVQQMRKQYRATFLLGRSSESDDVEREVIAIPNAIEPTLKNIVATLPQFIGDIQQRPPAHSAIKIGGKRAYKLAREGADFEISERTVTIHQINIIRYEYPVLELDVECGSGTYIRSLGRDLGAALGTAAVMSALERTAIGPFTTEKSLAVGDLSPESLRQHLQPALTAVADMLTVEVSESQIGEIRHGRPISMPTDGTDVEPTIDLQWAAIDSRGILVALMTEKRPGQLWPVHNFDSLPSLSGAVDPA